MRRNSKTEQDPEFLPSRSSTPARKGVALLWDESFLWGLMAYKALEAAHLPFDLIRSEEIKAGRLEDYGVLFVPGGWASNKLKSLGDNGIDAIKGFVCDGGNYLGFCGGAGLATLDGIGLLNVKRKPSEARVPSFSGRIRLCPSDSPLWDGIAEPVFHAWWPSQFVPEDGGIKVLATYGKALPDSFSSDLNVGDAELHGNWSELEEIYRINLNPERLLDEPAVIEGGYGKGKAVLSLIHFDTPGDGNSLIVLKNIWRYLGAQTSEGMLAERRQNGGRRSVADETLRLISELSDLCEGLIFLGIRNFLWFWRNPMLLQWRRGVRGLEYCTLYVMMKEIEKLSNGSGASPVADSSAAGYDSSIRESVIRLRKVLVPFIEKAGHLLILERKAMQNWPITYEKCDDPVIREMRTELFSNSKSHGGLFKTVIDEVDALLCSLLLAQLKN